MAVSIKILNLRIIGPFVRDVESGTERTSVRISSSSFKEFLIEFLIEVIDGVVEGKKNHLRDTLRSKAT